MNESMTLAAKYKLGTDSLMRAQMHPCSCSNWRFQSVRFVSIFEVFLDDLIGYGFPLQIDGVKL